MWQAAVVSLQGLIDAGKGDVYVEKMNPRCTRCGSLSCVLEVKKP